MLNLKAKPANFIVKYADEYGKMSLIEAAEFSKRLEGEWRLPTVEECLQIKNGIYVGGNIYNFDVSTIRDEHYLTSSFENSLDLPMSFSFSDEMAYLSVPEAKHQVRFVQDNFMKTKELNAAQLSAQITEIMSSYIENFDRVKCHLHFQNYFKIDWKNEIKPWRYLLLEDYNMSKHFRIDDFSYFNVSLDMDMLTAWEDYFYDFDLNPDLSESMDERHIRENFIGIIDLKYNKYLRLNGYGDYYEFDETPPLLRSGAQEENPTWQAWTK
jgi:hypothetical protein